MPPSLKTGIFSIELPDQRLVVRLTSRGDPETIRRILRKATSHRRSIVSLRPGVFFANVIRHLVGLGQDIVEFCPPDTVADKYSYSYDILVDGLDSPMIRRREPSQEAILEPLFSFLGAEWKQSKTAPYIGRRRGRRSALYSRPEIRTKLARERIASEENPDSHEEPEFEEIPAVEPGKEIWRQTLRERMREKGRRLGKRLIRVDFDLMQEPGSEETD